MLGRFRFAFGCFYPVFYGYYFFGNVAVFFWRGEVMRRLYFKCLQKFDWRNDELNTIGVELPMELVINFFRSILELQKLVSKFLAINFFGVF